MNAVFNPSAEKWDVLELLALLNGKGVRYEMGHLQELVKDGVYLNSGWIAGQQPIELSPAQKSWAERWQ